MFEICSEECSDDHDQVLPIRLMAETSKPFLVIFSHLPLVCDFGCGFGWGEPGTSPVSTIIVCIQSSNSVKKFFGVHKSLK